MSRRTYLPLLMDRWTAGTQELTFEQRGFYISLLVWMYDTGEAVKDADHAARILRCDKRTSRRLLAELSPKFRRTSAGLRHKVLDNLLRNGGRIKGLEAINFPTVPDPDPEKEKDTPTEYPKRKLSTGSRLPEDWTPEPRETMWASQEFPAVNLTLETDKFRDYWLGVPGQRGRKASWPRTWRNWIRKAAESKTPKTNGSDYDKPIRGSFEWQTERARERMEQLEASEVLGSDEAFVREALGTGIRTRD